MRARVVARIAMRRNRRDHKSANLGLLAYLASFRNETDRDGKPPRCLRLGGTRVAGNQQTNPPIVESGGYPESDLGCYASSAIWSFVSPYLIYRRNSLENAATQQEVHLRGQKYPFNPQERVPTRLSDAGQAIRLAITIRA